MGGIAGGSGLLPGIIVPGGSGGGRGTPTPPVGAAAVAAPGYPALGKDIDARVAVPLGAGIGGGLSLACGTTVPGGSGGGGGILIPNTVALVSLWLSVGGSRRWAIRLLTPRGLCKQEALLCEV